MSLLASRKRQIHEVDKYDNIKEPRSSVMIDGAVTTLSPVKKGKRSVYFDGTLTDGTSHIRVVGFNPDQQRKLSSYFDKKEPARLINCEVKPAREGNTMEIMLKKFTEITSSPKKIAIPEDVPSTPNVIKIIDLPSINNFQRVSVDIKVVAINEPLNVAGGKTKQDITVADDTSTARLTLWQENVDTLTINGSYHLSGMVVREFQTQKYLSMARIGTEIKEIEDIGDVIAQPHDGTTECFEITDATIIGVIQLDSYNSCMNCKARVETINAPNGNCSKCSMLQRVDKCTKQLSAKLLFDSAGSNISLHAFTSILMRMIGYDDNDTLPETTTLTQEQLLNTPCFTKITYNESYVITGFSLS